MRKRLSADRLTVSLATGQKEALEDLADANGLTLAMVVRMAIDEFLSDRTGLQLRLTLGSSSAPPLQ